MRTFLLSILFAAIACAQPAFEVASIKPSISGDGNESTNTTNDSLTMRNVSLRHIIQDAYNLKRYTLTAPDWVDNLRFDINAKAEGKTKPDDFRVMLQSLLKERFQLKAHREPKTMSAYALLPAKTGFKLKPAEGDGSSTNSTGNGGSVTLTCKHVSMVQLADALSGRLDRPVVDQSGLPDAYDFTLEWNKGNSADETGPSIFTVLQEKLGLRLEQRKLPVEILVVDSVSRTPSEN